MINDPGIPGPRRSVEFHAVPSRADQVRRIVAAQLRYWQVPQLIDDVARGAGRLLAEVGRDGGGDRRCTVAVELLWDRLTVSVCAAEPERPGQAGRVVATARLSLPVPAPARPDAA